MAARLPHLKTRAQYLHIAGKGRRWAMPGLVLQAAGRPASKVEAEGAAEGEAQAATPQSRVGFTASRKVGNAVARNRAKRRLRALANEILPERGRADLDYVLICRASTPGRAFGDLRSDLIAALERVNRQRSGRQRPTTANPGATGL
ncbi:MAG: hypothetical protein Kilf2KO_03770 [Rhodospirillales bacterium]